ncbi:MAG: hypothetical protein KGH64_02480, partial [Candidatus Micrarchaeota archaeon]|nr:hypothetical protein [Candidatus Micrarchaeota archaeon]
GETDVEILGGRNGKSRLIISPTLGDVQVLEGTVWWEARPKSEFGTVESRCPALQPSISEIMAVGALIKGLSVNINGARGLVGELSENQGALADARRDVIRRGLDARVEGTSSCMSEITGEMLEIAKKGLRNSGENTGYLVPLYERLEKGVTPAEKALELFRNNTRKKFLKGLRLELE